VKSLPPFARAPAEMSEHRSISTIADRWIAEAIANKAMSEGEAIDCKYSSILDSLMFDEPTAGWMVIRMISQDVGVDPVDDIFGMGPLSSFVFHHGLDFRKAIHEVWKANQRFREQYKMVVFRDLAEAIIAPDDIAGRQ
jgi:hypothetical protein